VVRNILAFLTGELLCPFRSVAFFLLPYLGWSIATGMINGSHYQTMAIVNSLPVAVIAILEYRRAGQNRRYLITLAIALACLFSIMPYWFAKFGVNFGFSAVGLGSTKLIYGGTQRIVSGEALRGGLARFALAGADYNYAGSCMDICIATFLCLFIFPPESRLSASRFARWACILPIVIGVPAALATLSRGTALGVALAMAVPLGIQYLRVRKKSLLAILGNVVLGVGGVCLVAGAVWLAVGTEVREYAQALFYWQLEEGSLEGKGRMQVYQRGIDALTGAGGNPLFGYLMEPDQENHNIFLDAATYSGVPGFAMLLWIMFWPYNILRAYKTLPKDTATMLSIYTLALFAAQTLSLLNFKLLWIAWGILMDELRTVRNQCRNGRPANGAGPSFRNRPSPIGVR